MPSTLAQYRTRIAARLVDAANAVFATATLDEALRAALADYAQACPLTAETVLVLPAAGREIALNGVAGLTGVTDVWWPYDSGAGEVWPPNRVRGWRLWWDDAQPVLFLAAIAGAQPQAGDELRLWYTRVHTVQDLDGAATTTVFDAHEAGLVTGAAGYAAASEHLDQAGAVHLDPTESAELRYWAAARQAEFRAFLGRVRASAPAGGPPFASGWLLDRWDQ